LGVDRKKGSENGENLEGILKKVFLAREKVTSETPPRGKKSRRESLGRRDGRDRKLEFGSLRERLPGKFSTWHANARERKNGKNRGKTVRGRRKYRVFTSRRRPFLPMGKMSEKKAWKGD